MADEKLRNTVRIALTNYLSAKKMRCTPERFAILDKVAEFSHHFAIGELYGAIEADGYHVSLATIYNTISLLVDAGIVRRHHIDAGETQYELAGPVSHLHLICDKCGKVKEVRDAELASLIGGRAYSAFHAEWFRLYVHGTCNACLRRARRRKKQ